MTRTPIATSAAPSADFPEPLTPFACNFTADSAEQVCTYLRTMADLVEAGGKWTDAERFETTAAVYFLLQFEVTDPAEIPAIMRAVADAIEAGNLWSSIRNADDMEIGWHQLKLQDSA